MKELLPIFCANIIAAVLVITLAITFPSLF